MRGCVACGGWRVAGGGGGWRVEGGACRGCVVSDGWRCSAGQLIADEVHQMKLHIAAAKEQISALRTAVVVVIIEANLDGVRATQIAHNLRSSYAPGMVYVYSDDPTDHGRSGIWVDEQGGWRGGEGRRLGRGACACARTAGGVVCVRVRVQTSSGTSTLASNT